MDQLGRSSVWMNALQISGKSVNTETNVYLDYAATAPPDGRVVDAMMPYLADVFGNPSSVHAPGRRARHAVEEARERIARVLNVEAADIVFTGGGTEADNMALNAMLDTSGPSHLITGEAEHEAVRQTALYLSGHGVRVTMLPPDQTGAVRVESVEAALGADRPLVSLMHVNNETGAVTGIEEIGKRVHAVDGIFHTDAVQSATCYRLSELVPFVDMMTLSAHKIGGPKGVGMLYVRPGITIGRLAHGGAQERSRRAGTENVAGIVGLATALEYAQADPKDSGRNIRIRRDALASALKTRLGDRMLLTTPIGNDESAPHILHALFQDDDGRGLDGEMLILGLDMEGVYVSSGAACSSGAIEPSHVLSAMKVKPGWRRSAIRFSLGNQTTDEEIARACERIIEVVHRVGKGK